MSNILSILILSVLLSLFLAILKLFWKEWTKSILSVVSFVILFFSPLLTYYFVLKVYERAYEFAYSSEIIDATCLLVVYIVAFLSLIAVCAISIFEEEKKKAQ
ncbi:MAG: hypothetical protein ACP5LN_10895 [Thermoproteota archaeon]|jgi:hypothetical protein